MLKLRRNLPNLAFGINTNVKVSAIDIDPQYYNEERINQSLKVSFAKLSDTGRKEKETTISLGYLPDVNRDRLYNNICNIINRITSLLDCFATKEEWGPAFANVFVNVPVSETEQITFTTLEEVEEYNWSEEQIFAIFDRINAVVAEVLKDRIGLASKPVSVKMVYTNKGRLTAPNFGKMIEPYTTDENVMLKLDKYDKATRTKVGATRDTLSDTGLDLI